jgi:hypothetical protein
MDDNPLSPLKRLLELSSAAGPHVQDATSRIMLCGHSRMERGQAS